LNNTVTTLQSDLNTSRSEHEKSVQELEHLRTQVLKIQQQSAQELAERDNAIRELQVNLEHVQGERGEWEMMAMQEKGLKDELNARIKHLERDIEVLKNEKEVIKAEKEAESESLANLQAVLEEFQAAKESEIREVVEGIQRKLATATSELSEYKERAILAENQLSQIKDEFNKTQQYEREIKEKNLQI
ncbi:11024_t:CDS:2, partial [Ambispora leptoticha]